MIAVPDLVPLEPSTGGVAPANIAAIIAGELAALAADAQTLGRALAPGDVVQAVVLPSNGLTDLLEIDGLRVAAELPPTLLPGEVITVTVMGLNGDRIELHIMPKGENVEPAPPQPGTRRVPRGAQLPALGGERASASTSTRASAPAPAQGSAPKTAAGVAHEAPYSGRTLAARQPPTVAAEFKPVEARLAAARAASPRAGSPPIARPSAPPAAARTARPFIGVRALPAPPASAPAAPAGARGPAAFTDPAALLRALRIPVTATNLASARMALESPEQLPNALTALERALGNGSDPRVATLGTLTSFIARLDPRSPVFATQIAAFVDHVVIGGEAKLAKFARASDDVAAPREAAPAALERVAVARAAIDSDLKTQLLALRAGGAAEAAPSSGTTALESALTGALTAITALQLTAAGALDTNPAGLAFAVPIVVPGGVAEARIRIDREAPEGAAVPLDGDNFHIGFVLDTRHLGTIAIDVSTVGRTVTLSVKTEAELARGVFGKALGDLTTRLETLRYRVAKADAVVVQAPAVAAASASANRSGEDSDPTRLVDTDA